MHTPASRETLLGHPDALNCTVYRVNEQDPEGDEQDLGDARILITGTFEPPVEWDAKEREEYYDGMPPDAFVTALIACEAAADSKGYFTVEADDYAAVTQQDGMITMFYVCDRLDDGSGQYVLLREEEDEQ